MAKVDLIECQLLGLELRQNVNVTCALWYAPVVHLLASLTPWISTAFHEDCMQSAAVERYSST